MIRSAIVVAAGSVTLLAAQGAKADAFTSSLSYNDLAGVATETLGGSISTTSAQFNIDQFQVGADNRVLTSVHVTIEANPTIQSGYISNNDTANVITGGTLSASESSGYADSYTGASVPGALLYDLNVPHITTDTYVATMGQNGNPSSIAAAPNGTTSTNGIMTAYVDEANSEVSSTPIDITITDPFSFTSSLSDWEGNSTMNLALTLTPSFAALVTGTTKYGAGGSIANAEDIVVTYDYYIPSKAPEPTGLMVMLSGMLGLAGMMRRIGRQGGR